ncbi:MAG TPA: hypothetical protein VMT36_08310, partial [Candidatus Saccharimonadia bacterium]|nr:hypothetical protein [Candidatus Saccharimonadia bacterium]
MTIEQPATEAQATDMVAVQNDVPVGAAPGRRRMPRVVAVVLVITVILVVVGGAIYVAPQQLLPEATAALASTDEVTYAD